MTKFSNILILSLAVSVFSLTALASPDTDDNAVQTMFQMWKLQLGKEYASSEEEAYRYTVFLNNYQFIQEYNSQGHKAVLGLTQFADLHNEEFASMMTGGVNKEALIKSHQAQEPVILETVGIPDYVNWVQAGYVTSVKNQGQCGGCWAFAASASLESYYALTGGALTNFSPQELIDCVNTCDGCNGCDNIYNALAWTSQYGIESWSDYPFEGGQESCQYNSGLVVTRNQGYQNVAAYNMDQLLAAIAQQPTNIAVEADQSVFQLYTGGIIGSDCGDQIDHAITAVGYGSYDGVNVYLVKNSWGPSWGIDGFAYIAMEPSDNGGAGACGILTCPVYPTQI